MKLNLINKKKLLIILMSSLIITTLSGCKSETDITTNNTQYEDSNNVENETTSSEIITENTSEIEYSNNDLLVINEFENIEKELNEILENDKDFLNKAKGVFITIVDFIFYNSEINGVKFDELTENGKQKVLEISNNIDLKIENKFPNYKNDISEKASEALNKASKLIEEGSNNIEDFTKEKLGEENYNTLIEVKDELVEYTKNAFDIIGDFSSELYDNGKQKIKDWYEELKNN